MISLLESTKEYIHLFKGIRISTRPDCINQYILDILKKYNVTSIELGAQSMDNEVLINNNRGHFAEDVINSSKLIKENGFSLGLQMMTGLYCSDDSKDIYTANEFINIKPETVRIYPTIVMKNTRLAQLYENNKYSPQTLDDAVNLCSYLLKIFNENNINVIRLGLHDSQSLKEDMVSGPYHPSFRELCESKLLLDKFLFLTKNSDSKFFNVYINEKSISKFIGNKKSNLNKLLDLGINVNVNIDNSLSVYDLSVD